MSNNRPPLTSLEHRYRAEKLIKNIHESNNREEVLIQLNNFIIQQAISDVMRMDLGFHLWNSPLTVTILLQEVIAVYPKFLNSTLTMKVSARFCNALIVFQVNITNSTSPFSQCVTKLVFYECSVWPIYHPDARMGLLKGSFDESYGQEILLLLLDRQVFPLCLHCIHHGDQPIRAKILLCSPNRFLSVIQVLCQLVDTSTSEIPCSQQLKYVVQCYLSLSRVSWVGGVYDRVRTLFPHKLINNNFHNIIHVKRRYRTEQLIMNLRESSIREEVLIELNNFIIEQSTEAMRMDLGFHLWNSEFTLTILLQEVVAVYPKLLDSTLAMAESTRLCNALNVIQCMASHPNARIGLLKGSNNILLIFSVVYSSNTVLFYAATIPYFLYPFLRISENVMRPLQFVKLTILNLIAALAKFDESYGQEILLLLLDTQVFSLCLLCIHHGDQLIRKVATLILMKILMQEKGLKYCCALPARFLLVIQVLHQLVDTFASEIPCSQQLKNVVQCYLSLSRVAWAGGVYDAVRTYFPLQLIDYKFGIIIRDDPEIPIMLHQLELNLTRQPRQ
ncbi:hypothetical protein H5410_028282 [Solanum commersonii]|uniref:Uncharacterized protein n=1 Tax=Solanum commersonii TaxID=4109 RepID=A0A9J5Z714_SOLCO|nr:hypothetical protein H5410_028282 [Solanum commersonii]